MILYVKSKISVEKGMNIINNKQSSIIDKLLRRKDKIFSPDIYYLPFYVYECSVRDNYKEIIAINGVNRERLIIDREIYSTLEFEEESKEHIIDFKFMEYETKNTLLNSILKRYYSKNRINIDVEEIDIEKTFPCYIPFLVFYILNKKEYSLILINGISGKIDYSYKELVQNKIISEKFHDKIIK